MRSNRLGVSISRSPNTCSRSPVIQYSAWTDYYESLVAGELVTGRIGPSRVNVGASAYDARRPPSSASSSESTPEFRTFQDRLRLSRSGLSAIARALSSQVSNPPHCSRQPGWFHYSHWSTTGRRQRTNTASRGRAPRSPNQRFTLAVGAARPFTSSTTPRIGETKSPRRCTDVVHLYPRTWMRRETCSDSCSFVFGRG